MYESCGKTMDSVRFARIRLARLVLPAAASYRVSEIRRNSQLPLPYSPLPPLSLLPFFSQPPLLVYRSILVGRSDRARQRQKSAELNIDLDSGQVYR